MDRRTLLGTVAAGGGMVAIAKADDLLGAAMDSNQSEGSATGGSGGVSVVTDDTPGGSGGIAAPDPELVERRLAEAINGVRFDNNRGRVGRDSELRLAAREHSTAMHEDDFFGHEHPETGRTAGDRAPCAAGETIGWASLGEVQHDESAETWDTTTADGAAGCILEGWILSDEHYEILLNDRYGRVGVGVAIGVDEFWATALFCG